MVNVKAWVIEDINCRRNLLFLNNIKRRIIKFGDETIYKK